MLPVDNIGPDKLFRRYDILAERKESPELIAERMLPVDPKLRKVAEDIVFMKNKVIEKDIMAAMKLHSPEDVIEHGLISGMDIVAELYGRGIYYLPHVMVASDAMDKGIRICERYMSKEHKIKGVVLMHVAEGDPHDIGKNIAAALLKSSGYGIVDMGRDVPIENVVKEVEKVHPIVLTGTALMTTTMSAFPQIAAKLKEKSISLPFICAGGAVNRSFVESYPMGIYGEKARLGTKLVDKALSGMSWEEIRERWDSIHTSNE